MRKKLQLLFILGFISNTYSQTLELPKNIQSPNAASLGKYGDIPMDLSTGRANVSVPLHSVNEGGIALDISIGYDTGGVRVNDVPGWVGQNWSLSAGGVITRTQKGIDIDEAKAYNTNLSNPNTPTGYMYYKSDLNTANWNDSNYLKNLIGYSNTLAGRKDYEPDIFTFNFMGHTGKFFLGNDGLWKVSSQSNLKIEINDTDFIYPLNITKFGSDNLYPNLTRTKVIGKIKIIDDKGNVYIFGKNQNDIEFIIPNFGTQTQINISSNAWYLSEVYDKYNSKIYSFTYERGDDQASFYSYASYKIYRRDACSSFYGSAPYANGSGDLYPHLGGSLIKPIFLKSITTKSGVQIVFDSSNHNSMKYSNNDYVVAQFIADHVNYYNSYSYDPASQWSLFNRDFWYSTHLPLNNGNPNAENPIYNTGSYNNSMLMLFAQLKWRKLNRILISNQAGFSKTVSFNYKDISTQRLKLENLIIDNQFKYAFEYENFDFLPSYLSLSFDHFGYFTGRNYGYQPIDAVNHYANRETDVNKVKYGSLTKISYPTGGYTTFEYEPHTYASYLSNDRASLIAGTGAIGGLRIKKTIDAGNNGSNVNKEYLYQNTLNETNPNGILLLRNLYYVYDWAGKTDCGSLFYQNSFSTNSIVPMSNFSGTHIEYPKVIERKTDGVGNYIGYTLYNYSSVNDYKDNFAGTVQPNFSIFDAKTDLSFKRQQLRFRQYYDNDNHKTLEEEYIYTSDDSKKSRALSFDRFAAPIADGNLAITGTAYEIYYSDNNLVTKKTRTFDSGNQYLEETENYNYVGRENFGDNFLRSKSKTTTNNEILKEEYQYTFDKSNTAPYNTLTDRREFSIVKADKTLDNVSLSSVQTDYAQLSVYDNNGTATSATQTFPQKFFEAKGINALEEKLMVDKYDANGNILQAHKPDGKYIFYFYAYNNRYPIMKIEGPKDVPVGKQPFSYYASLLRTKIEATTPDMNDIIKNQFYTVSDYPEHLITCYTFKPDVGVTSIMNPNASVEFYNYDSIGRLISIKDINGKTLKNFSYELANQ